MFDRVVFQEEEMMIFPAFIIPLIFHPRTIPRRTTLPSHAIVFDMISEGDSVALKEVNSTRPAFIRSGERGQGARTENETFCFYPERPDFDETEGLQLTQLAS
ncbi:hypothetical protein TNIN_11671 [Trichonephila inaurata madagascariensis]|uniref:Uncharacterized protein n=1 Tax=Trichonephila inaurata madagascariensis TaxID=2747483 RepID=A0A8X6YVT5_9ARAC|nr:hypothetical protein TNIN_11671 [Trichonephila inaurata madagascariensis]